VGEHIFDLRPVAAIEARRLRNEIRATAPPTKLVSDQVPSIKVRARVLDVAPATHVTLAVRVARRVDDDGGQQRDGT
jgi:hypothetical protein